MTHRPLFEQRAFGLLLILQKQIYDREQLFVHSLKQAKKEPPVDDLEMERIWLTNKP